MLYDVKSVLQDSEKRTITTMAMIAGETGTSLAKPWSQIWLKNAPWTESKRFLCEKKLV